MKSPPEHYEWPSGWRPCDDRCDEAITFGQMHNEVTGDDQPANSLAKELQREVCAGHPLHGRVCHAVAYSTEDPNEFIFATDDPQFPLAFVHLTWSIERSPEWPYTVRYESWEAFRIAWNSLDTDG